VISLNYEISPESGISDYFFSAIINDSRPPHVHSHIEFIYVLEGAVCATISDKTYPLKKGDMAVSMPYEIHSYDYADNSVTFVLACPPEYLSEYRQLLTGKVFSPPVVKFTDIHKLLTESIVKENFTDDLKKKALLYCTVSEFFNTSELTDTITFEYDVYRKAIVYISENFKENITLEKTALYAGVTPEHLSRVLNSGGKRGFCEILNSMRIYEARNMLERSKLPISEIALDAGFGSIRNFNRIFLRYFGCTPKNIRMQKNNSGSG